METKSFFELSQNRQQIVRCKHVGCYKTTRRNVRPPQNTDFREIFEPIVVTLTWKNVTPLVIQAREGTHTKIRGSSPMTHNNFHPFLHRLTCFLSILLF